MEDLELTRKIAGIVILIAAVAFAFATWKLNTTNNKIGDKRHDSLKEGQDSILGKIDDIPSKMKDPIPDIVGTVEMGVRKVGYLKDFRRSNEKPDNSEKRKASWPQFSRKRNLDHLRIPMKISNNGDFTLSNISFRIHYKTPTYIIGKGSNSVPINAVRNFPAYADIPTGKIDKDKHDPIYWSTCKFKYDDFKIETLEPNEIIEFDIFRITDKLFLKTPDVEIIFYDQHGNQWKKLNSEAAQITKAAN
jgi:hypothetical protein